MEKSISHYQDVEIMSVTQPEAGVEVMCIASRDLNTRSARVSLCVSELGAAMQSFFMDFRPWKDPTLPFVNYKPNSQGEFMRVYLPCAGRNKKKSRELLAINATDREVIRHLSAVLHRMTAQETFTRFVTTLGHELWVQELWGVRGVIHGQVEHGKVLL